MTHWIQDYIDLVRSGKYPVCEEQHMLIELVEREFKSGRIYVDEEQLEKYMSYQVLSVQPVSVGVVLLCTA